MTTVPQICPCKNCGCGLNDIQGSIYAALNEEQPQFSQNRLQELLASNKAPMDGEKQSIHTFLDQPMETLKSLDAQILSIDDFQQDLRSIRHELASFLEPYRLIANAARRVPNEILGDIFLTLVESTFSSFLPGFFPNAIPSKGPRSLHMPASWGLAMVCSGWREVVLSYPALWSFIQLTEPLDDSYYLGTHRETLDFQNLSRILQLSDSSPLHLSIASAKSLGTIKLLLSCTQRVTELYVGPFPESLYSHIARFPALITLRTFSGHLNRIPISPPSAPNLRTLILSSGDANALPPGSDHLAPQISELIHDGKLQPSTAVSLLRRCLNVQRCSLHIHNIRLTPIEGDAVMQQLEHLTLDIPYSPPLPSQLPLLGQHFSAPHLTSLDIRGELLVADALTFIRASGCTLTAFRYSSRHLTEAGCIDIMTGLPTLTRLALDDTRSDTNSTHSTVFTSDLFDMMTTVTSSTPDSATGAPRDGAPEMLPALRELIIPNILRYSSESRRREIARIRPGLSLKSQ